MGVHTWLADRRKRQNQFSHTCAQAILEPLEQRLLLSGDGLVTLDAPPASDASETIYEYNFEASWDNWWSDYGIWEVGTPTSGPNAAYSGEQCAATVLAGNYPYGPDSRLISPQIQLADVAVGEELVVRFRQWWSYQSADHGYVQIQAHDVTGGEWSGWTTLKDVYSYDSTWHEALVDLTEYAGRWIRIGFYHVDGTELKSGPQPNVHAESSGWYIDDVKVIKQAVPMFNDLEDFEFGWDNWWSDYGLWEVGTPTSGPNEAYSGEQCAATILNGKYPYGPDSRLISPQVQLPAAVLGQDIALRFRQWWSYSPSDRGYVQIQSYDESSELWSAWTTLYEIESYNMNWHHARVDLAAFAGQRIRIGFYHVDGTELQSGPQPNVHAESTGWYIDDVQIVGLAPHDNYPPTVSLQNTTATLPENTDTASRIKVADVLVSDDSLGTNALTLGGADAAMFELDSAVVTGAGSAVLYLKAGAALDYETNPILNVMVAVDDATVGATPDGTASLAINVTLVNGAPLVSLQNVVASLPENTDTSQRKKLADIVVTDDAVGTNHLSLSGADAALCEIDPATVAGAGSAVLYLKAGAALDCETNPILNVVVAVDDTTVGLTPDGTVSATISVMDVNEAPTIALHNVIGSLLESSDISSRIKVADVVVTDDALGTNALILSGADATMFEVEPAAVTGAGAAVLYLKAGTTLDCTTNPILNLTVAVDDATIGSTPDGMASVAITVKDVNGSPMVALQNPITSLPENTDTSSRVKVADVVVTDDVLGTNVLTLSGADAAMFELQPAAVTGAGAAELYLKAGTVLDHETNGILNVTVAVDDAAIGSTPDDSVSLSITVTDVNETPTVALQNVVTSLPENADTSSRIKIADVTVMDDVVGTNVLSLSGIDAAMFEIVPASVTGAGSAALYLKAGALLDHETNGVLDVTVTVNDLAVGSSPDDSESLTIAVMDVNEAPSVVLQNKVTTLSESTATSSRIKVADIVVTDDGLGTNALSLSGTDAAMFELAGTSLYLKAGMVLNHGANPQLDVTVAVDDVTVGSTPDGSDSLLIAVTEAESPAAVDHLVNVSLGRMGYDRRRGLCSMTMTITNTSAATIDGPMWVVIKGISSPEVTLAGGSGVLGGGYPYIDVTSLVQDGRLDPGETISLRISFHNPLNRRFDAAWSIYGIARLLQE